MMEKRRRSNAVADGTPTVPTAFSSTSSSEPPLSPSPAARRALAATAGSDTWKTSAGRTTGSDSFQPLDLIRVPTRKFARKFLWHRPKPGAVCPVCLEDPRGSSGDENDDDNNDDGRGGGTSEDGNGVDKGNNVWHMTSSCGHAVCVRCLRSYARSLVDDPSHRGPLKCPCCPRHLRRKDAVVALGGDPNVLRRWDDKMRDNLLRALPGYRPCPRCDGRRAARGDGEGGDIRNALLAGGGFVTPECLAPIHDGRERTAEWILSWIPMSSRAVLLTYTAYAYWCTSSASHSFSSSAVDAARRSSSISSPQLGTNVDGAYVDILLALLPVVLLPPSTLLCHAALATIAKRILLKPVVVGCPCCGSSFSLDADSELGSGSSHFRDRASAHWIGKNARSCPTCSVPIVKTEGCNHVKCAWCHSTFCWACMRPRTSCEAYRCGHGAPFGDAVPSAGGGRAGGLGGAEGPRGSVLDRIDRIERGVGGLVARPSSGAIAVVLPIVIVVSTARDAWIVRFAARSVVIVLACIFSVEFVMAAAVIALLWTTVKNALERLGTGQPRSDYELRTEEEMIAEAMARSLQEQ